MKMGNMKSGKFKDCEKYVLLIVGFILFAEKGMKSFFFSTLFLNTELKICFLSIIGFSLLKKWYVQ